MRGTIVILDEGNQPYPRCPQCDMFVSHKYLNGWQTTTDFCQQGAERKPHLLAEQEAREGAETEFTVCGTSLYPVTSFKYIRQILTE